MAAIRLAIKVKFTIIQFNESCDYPAAVALTNTGEQYTLENLLMAEQQLLLVLKFRLKYITPYCYIKLIKEMMPMDEEIFNKLTLIVEYCSVIPQVIGLSSGQILFAALLFLLKNS
jgi:hypothetical protein